MDEDINCGSKRYEPCLHRIMKTYEPFARDLELVQSLQLPNSCIAAGYMRNYVWDVLHGYPNRTPLNDVDVLYYDPAIFCEQMEKRYELQLKMKVPEYN